MKKKLVLLSALLSTAIAYSQVGINTDTPKATLDLMATPADLTKTDGLIAPRVKGLQLKNKDSNYAIDQTGAIVYVTEALAATDVSIKTKNVISIGYYYFDGSIWQKMTGLQPWYNVLTQDPATLNTQDIYQMGKVGINNTTPTNILHVKATADPVRFEGLQISTNSSDNIVYVDNTGVLKQKNFDRVKGLLSEILYVQGTSGVTVNQGSRADVPGVTVTHVVPADVPSQTLIFTVTGYATKVSNVGGGGQGVFELYQGTDKISSAYASVATGSGTSTPLVNLPVQATIQKSITLTPGTYTFKVAFAAWASNLVVNRIPSDYVGYDNDPEAMLTKMTVQVFNN
nr:hypothetical protein [uncultured Chryseobacterium sp.]